MVLIHDSIDRSSRRVAGAREHSVIMIERSNAVDAERSILFIASAIIYLCGFRSI